MTRNGDFFESGLWVRVNNLDVYKIPQTYFAKLCTVKFGEKSQSIMFMEQTKNSMNKLRGGLNQSLPVHARLKVLCFNYLQSRDYSIPKFSKVSTKNMFILILFCFKRACFWKTWRSAKIFTIGGKASFGSAI